MAGTNDTQRNSLDFEAKADPFRLKDGGKAKGQHRISNAKRESLPRSDFAMPGHGKGLGGKGPGSYPIDTHKRAEKALGLVGMHGSPSEKSTVRAAVHRRYPGIGQKD